MKTTRKIFTLFCCAAIVVVLLLSFLGENPKLTFASLFYRDIEPNSFGSHPTTLLETWAIVEKYINDNSLNVGISELISIDHPGDLSSPTIPGIDGRRRVWMAMLANNATLIRVTISDGKIISQDTSALDVALAVIEKPTVESSKAYAIAIANYPSLEPNGNHGVGYHYGVGADEQGLAVLSVVGGKTGGTLTNDMVVMVNPSSGELIRALVRNFDKAGGILFSEDGGTTWQRSNLSGVMTMAITKGLYPSTQGYAAVANGSNVILYSSGDFGKTWAEIGKLPPDAGNWATSMKIVPTTPSDSRATSEQEYRGTFFITTRHGAWTSRDGKDWSQIGGLPTGPIQWAAALNEQPGYRIFVSIIDGPEEDKGLYVSSDLINWTKIQNEGYYRLSESYDKTQVIAIEQNSNTAWYFTCTESKLIDLPPDVNNVAGNFSNAKTMIARTSTAFGNISNADNLSTIDIATIEAAPNFPDNGLVVAGGFRSGIYLSKNFGKSWELVLPDPSAIVPGNSEIWSITFLSEESLIAINGGTLTWEALP